MSCNTQHKVALCAVPWLLYPRLCMRVSRTFQCKFGCYTFFGLQHLALMHISKLPTLRHILCTACAHVYDVYVLRVPVCERPRCSCLWTRSLPPSGAREALLPLLLLVLLRLLLSLSKWCCCCCCYY
jgi:hypothetical protein